MSPRSPYRLVSIFALLGAALASCGLAAAIGMAGDDDGDQVIVFDPATSTLLGQVALGAGSVGDCAIVDDLGFMVDFESRLWVIDLAASPPVLAGGTNPIAMSNRGQDLAVAPRGELLVSCGGTHLVSVVDIASRSEIDTFDLGQACNSVEVCTDGSVLVGHSDFGNNSRWVRRLILNAAGELSDSGDLTVPDFPTNLTCAPDANSALVLQLGGDVGSVAIAGLGSLDGIVLPDFAAGAASAFTPSGDRAFLRAEGSTVVYAYDPLTGAFGSSPLLTLPSTGTFVPLGGVDTLAYEHAAERLWMTDGASLAAWDARTGDALPGLTVPGTGLTGVCLPFTDPIFADGFESGDRTRWSASSP